MVGCCKPISRVLRKTASVMTKLRNWLRSAGAGKEYSLGRALLELLDGYLYAGAGTTTSAPHVRDSLNLQRLLNTFVVATIPCWLIGMWNLGEQTHMAMAVMDLETAPGWRHGVFEALGVTYDPRSSSANLLHGLLYFAPIFIVALATGALWEAIFAKYRRRPADHGLLQTAWFFSLMMPATTSMMLVVLGMTFASVVGKLIFGGSGRYLINPALLGIAFLVFSYSTVLYAPGAWIPVAGYDEPTTIELLVDEGGVAALLSVNYTWQQVFLGNQPGPIGLTSIFGCLLGAFYLIYCGVASWRIMLGSLLGLIVTVTIFNAFGPPGDPNYAVPWYWHAAVGSWAFGTVFIATDPVAAANTNPGRWGFGFMVGVVTIVVRVTNPAYYDGMIFAILLACIFSPLFDYVVVQRNIRRRAARQEARK